MTTARAIRSLHFAVRPRVVGHYLGHLLRLAALLLCVPATVAFASGNTGVGLRYALAITALGLLGHAGARLAVAPRLQNNESCVIASLVFVLTPVFMAVPLMGYGLSFVDALFEAVSGVTTTGLSTLASVEALPASFHFARAWAQWIGGLGVVVLALALLLAPGAAANRLGFDRREMADVAGGTRSHARKLILAYCALTALGIAAVWGLSGDFVDSVVHVLAAISTGGFSSHDDSLAGMPSAYARYAVTAVCLLGAFSFPVYYRGFYGGWRSIITDTQSLAVMIACAAFAGLLYATMTIAGTAPDGRSGIEDAVLMAVSAQSTAGFSTLSVSSLDPASVLVLIMAMFIGGAIGSTAGGIKIFRLLIMIKLLQALLSRVSIAHGGVIKIGLDGQRLRDREIEAAAAMVLANSLVLFASWFAFLLYGYPPLQSLFEVTSAVATAGLSAGVTGPQLETPLKLLLCLDMLMGRVETIALIVLLLPRTWIGRRRRSL